MNLILPLEILNNMPWVWLGVAIVMTVIEGLTLGLTTIWLAIAALVSMVLAFLIPSPTVQITLFLLLSLGMLVFTRPIAVKKMKLGKEKTNVDRLIGMRGVVLEPVSEDKTGQVRVGGQIWTARSENSEANYVVDEHVQIIRIEGVTLIIGKASG